MNAFLPLYFLLDQNPLSLPGHCYLGDSRHLGVSSSEKNQRDKFLTFATKRSRMEHGQEIHLEEESAVSPSYQDAAAGGVGTGTINQPRSTRWVRKQYCGGPADRILRTRKVCSKL